jgi:hypothetical protein
MLLTVAVSFAILAPLGGLFCILLAGAFGHQTPLDMTHQQARTTSNVLIVVGGLLIRFDCRSQSGMGLLSGMAATQPP